MYYDSKKKNGTSGHNQVTCLFGEVLEELLGSLPLSQVDTHGINIGFGSTTGELQTFIIFIIVQQYNTQCKYTAFTDDVCWIHVIVIFVDASSQDSGDREEEEATETWPRSENDLSCRPQTPQAHSKFICYVNKETTSKHPALQFIC